LIYNKTEQAPALSAAVFKIGEEDITARVSNVSYKYSTVNEEQSYADVMPVYVDAGTYSLFVKAVGKVSVTEQVQSDNPNFDGEQPESEENPRYIYEEQVTDRDFTAITEVPVTISKAKLTYTWGTTSWIYDGNAHLPQIGSLSGKADGDNIIATVTSDGDTAGKSAVGTYTAAVAFSGDVANYELPTELTTEFSITKASLTIKWSDETTFLYNMNTQAPVATATFNNGRKDITLEVSGAEKNVGSHTAVVDMSAYKDSYEIVGELEKKYEITKYEVEIYSDSATKIDDGNILNCFTGYIIENGNKIPFTGTAAADGKSAVAEISGSKVVKAIRFTGYKDASDDNYDPVPNSYDIEYLISDEERTSGNYSILQYIGALTVTKDSSMIGSIYLTSRSSSVVYTGSEQKVEGFLQSSYTVNGVAYTVEGVTASVSGTNAGDYENTIQGTPVVKDPNGRNVTSRFNIQKTNGILSIKKAPLANATINLKYSLSYTGYQQTVEIASVVTTTGLNVPSSTYSVSGNTGTNAGSYTLT
ncbi:MAG: hypothetical protein J6N76_04930, partial [Lachnospiraceae bacterium]|nr:hypothetical protein [Lachnospiraceae bacterium]